MENIGSLSIFKIMLNTREQLDDIRQSIVRLETEARERRVYFERAKELAVSGLAAAGGFTALILLVRTLLSFPSVPDYVLSWTLDNHILPARLRAAMPDWSRESLTGRWGSRPAGGSPVFILHRKKLMNNIKKLLTNIPLAGILYLTVNIKSLTNNVEPELTL